MLFLYNLNYTSSSGPRMCMGEQLSRMEFFLMTANIFQTFSTTFPKDEPEPTTEPVFAMIQYPQDYKIVFTER